MIKFFYIFFFIILSSFVSADFYSFNDSFKPEATNFIYLIPVPNMTNTILILGDTCLNISGGRLAGDRCLTPSSITINFICENNGDCFLPDTCLNTLVCGLDTSEIEIGDLIDTLPKLMAVTLPIVVSVFFIGIAVIIGAPIIGVMGSIMLMSESWFIASMSPFFAYIIALLSFFLIIFFVFWRKNKA